MRLALVAGSTATAAIDGISAAGADADLVKHTPSADAEIVEYGSLVRSPAFPQSPTGCPTPAAVTRAARELLDFDCTVLDAGLARQTGAPTVNFGAWPGGDVRTADPVPNAGALFADAREFGRGLLDDHLVVGETIPGGTTTALGVLTALGEELTVSSSLPENPLSLKREVVEAGLDASDMVAGSAAGDPISALEGMGDPVLALVAGLVAGALEDGKRVTLGGGTQLLAATALIRHAGVSGSMELATTRYLAADVPHLDEAAAALDIDLTVTDPGFDRYDDPALSRFAVGEGKEGAGMGGALALVDRAGRLDELPETTLEVVRRCGGHNGP